MQTQTFPSKCCGHSKIICSKFTVGFLILLAYVALGLAVVETIKLLLPEHPIAYICILWVLVILAIVLAIAIATYADGSIVPTVSLTDSTPSSSLPVATVPTQDGGGVYGIKIRQDVPRPFDYVQQNDVHQRRQQLPLATTPHAVQVRLPTAGGATGYAPGYAPGYV